MTIPEDSMNRTPTIDQREVKVLFVVFKAMRGGHVLSALSIARQLRKRGVTPVFAGADGELATEIGQEMGFEEVQIPIYHGTRNTYFTWASLAAVKRLSNLIRQHNIDLVHAFDARSYMHAYPASLMANVPVVCTLCGGVDPYYNLPDAPNLIVFSEEQKMRMVNHFRWNADAVTVMRSRLDTKEILNTQFASEDAEARLVTQNQHAFTIMMISSFDSSKIDSIHSVLDAIEKLLKEGLNIQLVMIGGKGDLYQQAKLRGESIGEQFPASKMLFTGPAAKAFRYLRYADLVLGVGRSAFEGMALGRPTIVVGKNGFAGVVEADQVSDLAWYNFSGRNVDSVQGSHVLASEIKKLMLNPQRRKEIGEFGKQYIEENIEVSVGVPTTQLVYHQILDHHNRLARFARSRQWISFLCRLVPVIRDNSIHTIKRFLRMVSTIKQPRKN
ncbi:UDP-N-acetylglucosamine--N-acetylmuramyl-(pentapeptide) pyrophosphoryl-undecaprenol N-acetylglucosamine transferase [Rubripirellula obstinata]|uniref:UDP-N-acetylglucosamine--N-acetylmuramyl-(Pentapeptide) pyrophosphoryl-undecaprenol N-acetylglucosamine transferase n=1 Tax=Rubripirellula obstinata TaxID=406547 RepID=A0A5B1CIS0_9BACT|nr:glycosyltransferase family 4 protein [Rubripirellula obstinata]KAA1260998.1 UDP-N-acetylglucosamine--N-acetylmuramyl-(pentapeptide) pyrophosphoryl-undecaprenol N-acetylglucosamine transferase [Rubripirellula obstinata]